MDQRIRDKIKSELGKAEEYLKAAELLHRHGFFTPSVLSSYYSACHSAVAAFLTSGNNPPKEHFSGFTANLGRFSSKLDPAIERLMQARKEWGVNTSVEYAENDALLRMHQARDFFLEVKDFLRRLVKN
ncbi:MAG: HEPN domain-containing protein [Deltaproteobacteria bacterium]|nr:HEPN domain-containing protein [Deltaproteobacteria bacterium]